MNYWIRLLNGNLFYRIKFIKFFSYRIFIKKSLLILNQIARTVEAKIIILRISRNSSIMYLCRYSICSNGCLFSLFLFDVKATVHCRWFDWDFPTFVPKNYRYAYTCKDMRWQVCLYKCEIIFSYYVNKKEEFLLYVKRKNYDSNYWTLYIWFKLSIKL